MKALKYLLLSGLAMVARAEPTPPVLAIGSPAPAFDLPGVDGKRHSLGDFAEAKAICLVFISNHCPASVAARDTMRSLHADYAPKGVAVVAVNPNNPLALRPDELGHSPYNDSFEEMALFAKGAGWTFPYLYDGEKQGFARACGAQSTPHVFVFDGERKLRYTGRLDNAAPADGGAVKSPTREAIDAVLAGREVAEPVTRSIGCSTKWNWKIATVAEDQKKWESLPVTMEDLEADAAGKLAKPPPGRIRLIHFWATTCAPCVAEFPDLVDTYRRFQNREFDMVTISMDGADKADKARRLLQTHHAAVSPKSEPTLRKENRTAMNFRFRGENPDALAAAVDAEWSGAMPHSVIVNSDGKVLWRHTGQCDPVELRRAILEALDQP